MNKQIFVRDYIGGFNAKDFDRFSAFYAEDVKLSLSGKRMLTSRQEIVDFYRDVATRCDERLEVIRLVADDEGIAVELDTEFKALKDDPGFIAGPLVPGQSIFIKSVIFYTVKDGRFTDIVARRVQDATTGPSTF
jgi:predicted ester cyclase